jgi:hypothetical protein
MNIHGAIEVLEEVYGPFGAHDGVSQSELDALGQRLRVPVPPALQVLYRRTGRSEPLHRSHNALVEPGDVSIEGGHLVFYTENQNVCAWGIALAALGLDDPPIDVSCLGQSGELQWMEEFPSVTEFLCVQGAWQAIQGGLPFVGVRTATEVAGVEPKAGTEEVGSRIRSAANRAGRRYIASRATEAWIVKGCVFAMASDAYFGLAGREAEQFVRASEELGIADDDWDYATLRDDPPPS